MSLPGNGKMTPNGDQIHSRSPGNGTKMAVRSIDHANITKGDRVFAGLQLMVAMVASLGALPSGDIFDEWLVMGVAV